MLDMRFEWMEEKMNESECDFLGNPGSPQRIPSNKVESDFMVVTL